MRRPSRAEIRGGLRAALLYLLIAMLGAVVVLLLQPHQAPFAPTTIQVLLPTPLATLPPPPPTEELPPPEATPVPATPTIVVLPADTISLEIATLRQDLQRTISSIHLLKAASHLQTARLALRENNLPEVLRQLTVAQEGLDAAALLARDDLKGTIQAVVSDINFLRDDLPVRPETVDARLSGLWEDTTTLADLNLPDQ